MPRQRLGVVLLVPEPLATQIDGLRRALGDPSFGRISPHLTLIAPVNVAERDLTAALRLARDAAAATNPITVQLGPVTTFRPVNPVLYLDVNGDLDAVQRLRDGLFRPPFEREMTHGFVPHVTVADGVDDARIPAAVAALTSIAVDVTFDRLHVLAERHDEVRGRIWEPIADVPFAEPSVVGRGGLPLELTVSGRPDPEAASLLAVDGVGAGMPFAVTARRDGAVVGTAWGWTIGGHLELADLAVAVTARGEGVGRHLLAAVEALAARRDCVAVGTAAPGDGAAAALLAGAGWTPAGEPTPYGHRHWTRRL